MLIFAVLIKTNIVMTVEEAFIKFKEIYDFANIGKKIEEVVDINKLMKTPMALLEDTGLAYDGAILYHGVMTWFFAKKLVPIYEKIAPVNLQSLAKVIVLSQLGKVDLFIPNTNDWQVSNMGKKYVFNETNVCLKLSERSKFVCNNAGITFTLEEYEAMSMLDKNSEEYDNLLKYRSNLSNVFKMATELAMIASKERYKQSKK